MAVEVQPGPPADRELRRLLRQGTFAQVLDRALNTRGLTLERVQHHLAEQGIRVSRAALSYWRHGRSRPERAESLRAVQALEQVLGLPSGSLVSLLGPLRPRGRSRVELGAVDRRRLWPSHAPLMAALEAPPEGRLRQLAVHEHAQVGRDHRLVEVRARLVLEAVVDNVDRIMVYQWTEAADLPELGRLRYCRAGRLRRDEAHGATVAELVLDHRLAAGERTVVEYSWRFRSGPVLTDYHRRLTRPLRDLVLQVQFAGAAPARCVPYRQVAVESPRYLDPPLWIGSSHTVHLVLSEVPPGIVGLLWEWD
ncbi:XRE family transcriptional regulator [Hamadaea tsunoensis]|uniref:XRE family transcriptional regulator n=1 Tax=Hamadaea tsunoensis TaxID=53368 RepID=UPI00068798D0|nr:XRE family transcriptional regulator [Hamadaea tsunoensis]